MYYRFQCITGINVMIQNVFDVFIQFMVFQVFSVSVDFFSFFRYFQRFRKFIQLSDFSYFCYSDFFNCFLIFIHKLSESFFYKEVIFDFFWQDVMTEEFSVLYKTDIWDLVLLLSGKRAVGFRWVYKIKIKVDGSVERYKVRLVVKGFNQQYGMDYEEIFVSVAKMITVRILIVVVSVRRWSIFQMDVKNVFLNGNF